MKVAVVSYSLTGNNERLAQSIAEVMKAEHIKITESRTRKMGQIALDMLFNRSPQIHPQPKTLNEKDFVLFVAPVWMGQIASPLRAYFKYFNTNPIRYGFISISGGADGTNPKLMQECIKRAGKKPEVFLDLHIADLLPQEPKPVRKDTSVYQISDKEIRVLTNTIMKTLSNSLEERKSLEEGKGYEKK